jgi:hypothetical protein
MNLARYFVLSTGKEWLVTLDGSVMGRYPSRTEAIEAAIIMADLMGAMQYDADVVLEAEPGSALETVWTYGRDGRPTTIHQRKAILEKPRKHVWLVQRGEAA